MQSAVALGARPGAGAECSTCNQVRGADGCVRTPGCTRPTVSQKNSHCLAQSIMVTLPCLPRVSALVRCIRRSRTPSRPPVNRGAPHREVQAAQKRACSRPRALDDCASARHLYDLAFVRWVSQLSRGSRQHKPALCRCRPRGVVAATVRAAAASPRPPIPPTHIQRRAASAHLDSQLPRQRCPALLFSMLLLPASRLAMCGVLAGRAC